MEIKKKKRGIKKSTWILWASFILPAIILGGLFFAQHVYPFGDEMYLRSDCYHQYAPFYKELYRKMTEGGSLQYSWNIGMGVNFSAIYSYYLASPINILIGFLAPSGNVTLLIDMLILLKTALCGWSVAYYLIKRFEKNNIIVIFAGLFYALSSYMAAFSWNIMWLDCMVLLPIIVLGIERLVKEKKFLTYTISLGLAIFSNYYIAIMICIFAVMYFAVQLIANPAQKTVKYFASRIWLFGKYSIIAGGIGAAMIFPALYALSYTASGEMNFPEMWNNYFSILDMLSRSMIYVPVSIFNAHEPNLYCTVAVFMLIPLYCLSGKINKGEKYGKLALVAIFLISFNTNIPNYIWHGFHFPNSLPARQSFIYIFLLIAMGYEAVINVKEYTTKQIGAAFAGAIGLFLIIEKEFVDGDVFSFKIVYLSAIFLTGYYVLFLLYKSKKLHNVIVMYLIGIICIGEVIVNSTHDDSYKTTGYKAYTSDNEAITEALNTIQDKDFYRVEKLDRRTKNDAAWNNYHGVSVFSSTANSAFTDYLGYLGFEKSTNAYSYYGYTPFTSALLDVRYVFGKQGEDYSDNEDMELIYEDFMSGISLYKLKYSLPLGFMVPEYFDDVWDMSGNNPFGVQNSFASSATGVTDMFTQMDATCTGASSYIDVYEDSDVYFYCTAYPESVEYTITNEEDEIIRTETVSGTNHRQIVHVGNVDKGSIVTVSTSDENVSSLQLYAYAFHKDAFEEVFNQLNDEAFNVTEYTDTSVKGTVTALDDGLMYTSIIYDKGWTVYVDGKEVELASIKDALIAFPVSAGEHNIELKYTPTGFVKGWFITIGSILVLICCVLYDKNKKKLAELLKKKETEEAEDESEGDSEEDSDEDLEDVTDEDLEETSEDLDVKTK